MERVTVVGATRNFFKVGHTTLRTLASTRPDVRLRLGILDITDARRAVPDIDVELVGWSPNTPGSLEAVLTGTTAMLMVPPIDRRIAVARSYLAAAQRAGVGYILCLGIQHPAERCVMGQEAAEVEGMLVDSGIRHDFLRLPVFLENLLYQVPSISYGRTFRYPVTPTAPFSYVTCGDLGEVFARLLVSPPAESLGQPLWTSMDQLTCEQWAAALSEAIGATVRFEAQAGEDFVKGLVGKGMSDHAARAVLELWELVDSHADVAPTTTFQDLLGRPPTTAAQWTADHACCFRTESTLHCPHPKPPRDHMF